MKLANESQLPSERGTAIKEHGSAIEDGLHFIDNFEAVNEDADQFTSNIKIDRDAFAGLLFGSAGRQSPQADFEE